MKPLMLADFDSFFEAVHGVRPFPWQRRLAARLLEGEGWPATLSLPTASGKTASLDAAVFALAAEEGCNGERKNARRIFFIVDRRVVVDEAFARAQRIEKALENAKDGVLRRVADRLRELAGGPGEKPLDACIMRGGIYRDDRWARTPVQPTIVVSTVDQVGSRLLFRGYGVSPRSWPIHAGLVGNDSLLILDEAHCSQPFAETLHWIERYRGPAWSEQPSPGPFNVVSMTATPVGGGEVFEADENDLADEVLGKRCAARKIARLVEAKKGEDSFQREMEEAVVGFLKEPAVVGAIVNRVAAARQLFERLRKSAKNADVILLTGRVRPAERDALLRAHRDAVMASPTRPPAARSIVVVATQCIEVGADLDFDALVTECASLDALRQRFGRLDRLGRKGASSAVVVMRQEWTVSTDDPVYGAALPNTWTWLQKQAGPEGTDFGVNAMKACLAGLGPAEPSMSSPSAKAPIVMPVHCDLWAQTAPEPHVSPDPAAYLHGVRLQSPDVSLVWRADLSADETDLDRWAETVSMLAPSSGEALSIPVHAARAWLSRMKPTAVADVEGAAAPEVDDFEKQEEAAPEARRALRWCGPESDATVIVSPREIRPGDTLIVPSSYGGCDGFGWNPEPIGLEVADLADELAATRRKAVLRLHPEVLGGQLAPAVSSLGAGGADVEADAVRDALTTLAHHAKAPEWLAHVAQFLAKDRRLRFVQHPSGIGLVVTSVHLLPAAGVDPDVTDEDETSSASNCEVGLYDHLEHVGEQARNWVERLGLPPVVANSVALAAERHDLGKADPRFQVWLHGGDRIAKAKTGRLLAKSAGTPRTGAALRKARRAAGYPEGARHELVSVRLAEQSWPTGKDIDRDLVLHLVGTHHGHCRPFAPAVADANPVEVTANVEGRSVHSSSATGLERLDSGVADRFWVLVRRYGWWGLAFAEAVTRLSDHRASQREQEER